MASSKKRPNRPGASKSSAPHFNVAPVPPAAQVVDNMERKAIAQLAYTYWEARGRPWGSPAEDWFRAEQELKKSREQAFEVDNQGTTGGGL